MLKASRAERHCSMLFRKSSAQKTGPKGLGNDLDIPLLSFYLAKSTPTYARFRSSKDGLDRGLFSKQLNIIPASSGGISRGGLRRRLPKITSRRTSDSFCNLSNFHSSWTFDEVYRTLTLMCLYGTSPLENTSNISTPQLHTSDLFEYKPLIIVSGASHLQGKSSI